MSILIIALLLITSLKQLFYGGMFIEIIKKAKEAVKNEDSSLLKISLLQLIGVLLMLLILLAMTIYSFCLGLTIPAMFIPTVLMAIWTFSVIVFVKRNPDDFGKFTLFSVFEDVVRCSYYGYFLWILLV